MLSRSWEEGGLEINCVGGRSGLMDKFFSKIFSMSLCKSIPLRKQPRDITPAHANRSIPYHGFVTSLRISICLHAVSSVAHWSWLTCDTFSILYEKPSHLHLHLSKLCLQLAATNCRSWGASAATKKSNDYKGKHCDLRTLTLIRFTFSLRWWCFARVEGWRWNVENLFTQDETNFQLEFPRLAPGLLKWHFKVNLNPA